MSPRIFFGLFLVLTLVATGCQKKNEKRTSLRDRRARSGFADQQNASNQTNNTCHSQGLPGKLTGEVTSTSGDNAFWAELYYLTYPVLSNVEDPSDSLGFVSSQSNQSTGVRFWGNIETASGMSGPINTQTAEIRIEIFDDRACQPKADGETRPIVPIHIKPGFKSFKSVQGYVNGNQVSAEFVDAYGSIILNGTYTKGANNSGYFTGTMSYTLNGYSGQRTLGQFRVPTCGFFRCI